MAAPLYVCSHLDGMLGGTEIFFIKNRLLQQYCLKIYHLVQKYLEFFQFFRLTSTINL